jgi:hypothetical protein
VIAYSSCIGPYNSTNHPDCTKNRDNSNLAESFDQDKLYLMRKRQILDKNYSISNSKINFSTNFLFVINLIYLIVI